MSSHDQATEWYIDRGQEPDPYNAPGGGPGGEGSDYPPDYNYGGGGGGSGSSGGAGSSIDLGGLLGGLFSAKGQSDANQANAAEAKRNRDFQREMSDTSYQRGMLDMRKAGLNPMLAFSMGGASSPIGSMPVHKNIFQGAAGDLTSGINTGSKRMVATKQSELLKAQVRQTNAQTLATTAQAHNIVQATNTSAMTEKKIEQEVQKLRAEIPFRSDRAFGDVPNTGKAKMAWEYLKENWKRLGRESHQKNYDAYQRRRRAN